MFRELIFDKIKLTAAIIMLTLLTWLSSYAAVELPDESAKGSICVTLICEDTGAAIQGGTMTLYKAGEVVHDDDWNYSFSLTEEFTESLCSLDDPDKRNAEIAKELAQYANEKNIDGMISLSVDNEGRAVFTDLGIGLYLLVQTEASKGYYFVNPFMVSVPFYDETSKSYQYLYIDAFPKTEPAHKELPPDSRPEPEETRPGPEETGPEPEETKPSGNSSHSGSGGGSGSGSRNGGSSSGGPGSSSGGLGSSDDGFEESQGIVDFFPMPQTGQGRAMFIGVAALALSAMALIVLLWLKRRERNNS